MQPRSGPVESTEAISFRMAVSTLLDPVFRLKGRYIGTGLYLGQSLGKDAFGELILTSLSRLLALDINPPAKIRKSSSEEVFYGKFYWPMVVTPTF